MVCFKPVCCFIITFCAGVMDVLTGTAWLFGLAQAACAKANTGQKYKSERVQGTGGSRERATTTLAEWRKFNAR